MYPPYRRAAAVTPHATTSLATFGACHALWVGGAGNVTLTTIGGESVTITAVPAGTLIPIACLHITAATASAIIALYR